MVEFTSALEFKISSQQKLNYISEHYAAIARKSHIFRDEHIMDRAKENLEIIGKVYDYE